MKGDCLDQGGKSVGGDSQNPWRVDWMDALGAKGGVRWPSGFCFGQMNGCWKAVIWDG